MYVWSYVQWAVVLKKIDGENKYGSLYGPSAKYSKHIDIVFLIMSQFLSKSQNWTLNESIILVLAHLRGDGEIFNDGEKKKSKISDCPLSLFLSASLVSLLDLAEKSKKMKNKWTPVDTL